MDVQDQVYIISGVLGFTSLLFLILICVLFSWVQKLRREGNGGGGGYTSGGGGGGSGDLLEKRGFSEYKGPTVVSSPSSMTPATHGALSRQMSTAGYSSYQPPPPAPSSVVKAHTSTSAYGNPHAHGGTGYGKSQSGGGAYDNSGYEQERETHRDLTAAGVRVLPSIANVDHRRTNNYENSGYY